MEELRIQLAELINNSQLPFECKYYVLKDVFNEVNNLYRELLNQKGEETQDTDKEVKEGNLVEDSKE